MFWGGAVGLMAGATIMAVATTAWAEDAPVLAVQEVVVTAKHALANGEIVREGSLGILGTQDVTNTPFSVERFSADLIQNLQAKTLGEVLDSTPSVTRFGGRFNGNDSFYIRGFQVNGYDTSYDGLYGLSSVRHNGITGVDSIDVLKGPSALINGVPPSGAIGGSINLVPKRAGSAPVSELEVDYLSPGNVGGSLDLGRRFGPSDQFGARLNVAGRDGDTANDFGREREENVALALDWRIGKLRLYADLNYQDQRMDAAAFAGFNLDPGLAVPKAPRASINSSSPFEYTATTRTFEVFRAEYDIATKWTVAISAGFQNIAETQHIDYGPTIFDAAGDVREPDTYRFGDYPRKDQTYDFKLRGEVRTGPLTHNLALGAYQLTQTWSGAALYADGTGAVTNLYDYHVTWSAPSFAGAVPDPYTSELTLRGVAISDSISALDGRVQLIAGAREQEFLNRDGPPLVVDYDKSALTPAFALLIKPMPRLSLYANYIEGLSQAPSPPDTAANFQQSFPPAASKQTEVGAKVDLGRLVATLAFFDISQPSGTLDAKTNLFSVNGDERHRGVELEAFGEVVKGVRIIGGASYIDARLEKTDGGIDQGNRPVNVPAFTLSVGGEWDVPLVPRFTLTGRVVHSGDRFLDQDNTQRVPGWTRLDLGARYGFTAAGRPMTVRIEVTNIAGANYWESADNFLITGSPRTVSLSLATAF